jgi:hypothetical protein
VRELRLEEGELRFDSPPVEEYPFALTTHSPFGRHTKTWPPMLERTSGEVFVWSARG